MTGQVNWALIIGGVLLTFIVIIIVGVSNGWFDGLFYSPQRAMDSTQASKREPKIFLGRRIAGTIARPVEIHRDDNNPDNSEYTIYVVGDPRPETVRWGDLIVMNRLEALGGVSIIWMVKDYNSDPIVQKAVNEAKVAKSMNEATQIMLDAVLKRMKQVSDLSKEQLKSDAADIKDVHKAASSGSFFGGYNWGRPYNRGRNQQQGRPQQEDDDGGDDEQ